jgi:hypothetical protein
VVCGNDVVSERAWGKQSGIIEVIRLDILDIVGRELAQDIVYIQPFFSARPAQWCAPAATVVDTERVEYTSPA